MQHLEEFGLTQPEFDLMCRIIDGAIKVSYLTVSGVPMKTVGVSRETLEQYFNVMQHWLEKR